MLINKLLLEHHFMIVRSTDLNYLRYIMDFDLVPIVRWLPIHNFACVALKYGKTSLIDANALSSYIRPLTTYEIKNLLFNIKVLVEDKDVSIHILYDYITHCVVITRDEIIRYVNK